MKYDSLIQYIYYPMSQPCSAGCRGLARAGHHLWQFRTMAAPQFSGGQRWVD